MGISENAKIGNRRTASAGRFRAPFGSSKSEQSQKSKVREKMGKSKAIVSDVRDTIRNTFVGMAAALSGSEGPEIGAEN